MRAACRPASFGQVVRRLTAKCPGTGTMLSSVSVQGVSVPREGCGRMKTGLRRRHQNMWPRFAR
jgi:hypothetical protein